MAQRICSIDGCEGKHQARGLCHPHYNKMHREATGKSHHPSHERVCVTCGTTWQTPRSDARFCTPKCNGIHLSAIRRASLSKLPTDHQVMVLIRASSRARLEPRHCPGCATWFTPLRASNMVCCTKRCVNRVRERKRRAREHGASGTFTWSEFMRIARLFDYCCAYCSEPGTLEPEHVVPLSRGGSNSTTNLLPSCRMCNSDKRDLLLHEWAVDRERRGKSPRATSWPRGDRRYRHLTDASLTLAAA